MRLWREEFNGKHISVLMACSNAAQSLQYSSRLLHSTIHEMHIMTFVSRINGEKNAPNIVLTSSNFSQKHKFKQELMYRCNNLSKEK